MRIWSTYLAALRYKRRYLKLRLKPDCFRILCYGDSNTWGYVPGRGSRFSADVRWPGVLQRRLGSDAIVCEEGLCGRTTAIDDPHAPGRNGLRTLMPVLRHYAPLDLVIINLGTNDLKARFDQSAESVAQGAKRLCQLAQAKDSGRAGAAPDLLLVAPPPIPRSTSAMLAEFDGAAGKSKQLAPHFSEVALQLNIHFLNAGEFITPSLTDPVHWDASAHWRVGNAVADSVEAILGRFENG